MTVPQLDPPPPRARARSASHVTAVLEVSDGDDDDDSGAAGSGAPAAASKPSRGRRVSSSSSSHNSASNATAGIESKTAVGRGSLPVDASAVASASSSSKGDRGGLLTSARRTSGGSSGLAPPVLGGASAQSAEGAALGSGGGGGRSGSKRPRAASSSASEEAHAASAGTGAGAVPAAGRPPCTADLRAPPSPGAPAGSGLDPSVLRELHKAALSIDLEAAPIGGDSWLSSTLIDAVAFEFARAYPGTHFLPTNVLAFEIPHAARSGRLGAYTCADLLGRTVCLQPDAIPPIEGRETSKDVLDRKEREAVMAAVASSLAPTSNSSSSGSSSAGISNSNNNNSSAFSRPAGRGAAPFPGPISSGVPAGLPTLAPGSSSNASLAATSRTAVHSAQPAQVAAASMRTGPPVMPYFPQRMPMLDPKADPAAFAAFLAAGRAMLSQHQAAAAAAALGGGHGAPPAGFTPVPFSPLPHGVYGMHPFMGMQQFLAPAASPVQSPDPAALARFPPPPDISAKLPIPSKPLDFDLPSDLAKAAATSTRPVLQQPTGAPAGPPPAPSPTSLRVPVPNVPGQGYDSDNPYYLHTLPRELDAAQWRCPRYSSSNRCAWVASAVTMCCATVPRCLGNSSPLLT